MATYYSNTSVVYRLRLDLTEQSQSAANNTTTLAYALYWQTTNTAYGASRDADCDTFTLTINGSTVYSAKPAWALGASSSSTASSITLTSGTVTIAHDDDGSKSVAFSFSFSPLSKLNSYYPSAVSGSGTQTLTKIARYSTPTLSPSTLVCNGSNSMTITTNRALSTYTHTISYTFGSVTGTIGSDITDTVTWTPAVTLLQEIPNAASGTGTISCTTYNDGTAIGTSTVSFTLSTQTCSSLDSVTVTETSTISEIVSGADTVRYLSAKTISATATAYQGASIASVSVTCGSLTKALSGSGSSWSITSMTGMTAASYVVTLTDSRGLTTSTTVSGTYYPYTYPTITSLTVGRDTATSSTGTIAAEGEYYNALSNTVTAAISDAQTLTPTVTASAGDWEISEAISSVDYDQSFDFTLTITDIFGKTATKSVNLPVSKWTMWMGKDTVRIQDNLQVESTVRIGSGNDYVDLDSSLSAVIDLIYPIGAIYLTTSSTVDPNTLFTGTYWQKLSQGYYLMTAGSTYTAGTTGGNTAHNSYYESTSTLGATTDNGSFSGRFILDASSSVSAIEDFRPPYFPVYAWERVSSVTTTYTITQNLTDVSSSNAATSVSEGSSFTTTLTPASGYAIDSVTVTMDGVDITSDVFTGNE